ncbi:hypothetical protein PGH12_01455 [Chryseobacterium wangxinyae]|uniref:hypothetical protein n=1 Tax=Chryseobacterium sp. CY350 TaxID=2997336 RepID=UPI00227196CC|nr:hypothetical protein [Chryseobacterium sp. CY350]MCY0977152.1 hypothetical protein [Chryseobacterium sp. CY350]WBZ95827.1 hypothetical protein PGH12_01455 [Chryseobacterium sp. CY350]
MSDHPKRIIRKEFETRNSDPDKIRLGNHFVDDFIFDNHKAADIPINALRVIFNIVSIISSAQFRPEDRPKQLSLFDEEFETENNVFASIKIRNSKISPSGSTRQVVEAYEFLAKFKMSWHTSVNAKGKDIKTFGGIIATPSHDRRGYTTFLISSYWLKKLMVIPEYNYVLYNLVYNVRNNKQIIFAIWLTKIPENGTVIKLSTLNEKFGLNYKTAKDICFKFLKPAKLNLDRFNTHSFIYKYKKDSINIIPYRIKMKADEDLSRNIGPVQNLTKEFPDEKYKISRRLIYFRKRYGLQKSEIIQLSHQYRHMPQIRALIEKAFEEFIRTTRLQGIKSTQFRGMNFLLKIQEYIIQIYRKTKMGELLPNGYPIIV